MAADDKTRQVKNKKRRYNYVIWIYLYINFNIKHVRNNRGVATFSTGKSQQFKKHRINIQHKKNRCLTLLKTSSASEDCTLGTQLDPPMKEYATYCVARLARSLSSTLIHPQSAVSSTAITRDLMQVILKVKFVIVAQLQKQNQIGIYFTRNDTSSIRNKTISYNYTTPYLFTLQDFPQRSDYYLFVLFISLHNFRGTVGITGMVDETRRSTTTAGIHHSVLIDAKHIDTGTTLRG